MIEGVFSMDVIEIDNSYNITLEDYEKIINNVAQIKLSINENFIRLINKGHNHIKEKIKQGLSIYGVTTGFGDSSKYHIPYTIAKKLQENLFKYHGCGLGKTYSEKETRGIMVLRLIANSKGYSGVTYKLLKQLEQFIKLDIIPLIPELGSVGASGDLTPLSYIAATLTGRRKVLYKGRVVEASEALRDNNLEAVTLEPKEGLAIMNGTSVMTAVAGICVIEAKKIASLVELTSALSIEVLKANKSPFSSIIHKNKPHNGQIKSAENIMSYLSSSKIAVDYDNMLDDVKNHLEKDDNKYELKKHIQDKYSLRCSPHIIGALRDVLEWCEKLVTTEMNSVTDNPIIDYEDGGVYSGGNFYGGHICTTMDTLRASIADIADLIDKQLSLIIDEKFNNGLPPNLAYIKDNEPPIKHGLKAVQITCTSLTVEVLSKSNPIRTLSRPTEAMNQDKVSLGSISANHTRDSIELLKYIIAIQLISLAQAMDLIGVDNFCDTSKNIYNIIREVSKFIDDDRELDEDIDNVYKLLNDDKIYRYLIKFDK